LRSSPTLSERLPPALEASGFLGTWTLDAASGLVILDGQAAELLAGSADLAGRPLDLDTATARLHPDDRERVIGTFHEQRRRGGANALEYRVLSPGGTVRRVLDRGRIDHGPGDATHGSGVLIDVTENRPVEGSPSLLETAVDHLLIARRSLVGAETAPATRVLLDALLLELGRELARRMDTAFERPRS
jgi:hypothetical protein